MQKIILVLTVATIFLWNGQTAKGQENLQKLFPETKVIAESSFDLPVYKIFSTTQRVAVITRTEKDEIGKVHIFNNNGEQLWQKQFKWPYRVSMAENSNKIVVISEWNLADEQRNTCFDQQGNKLWEIWVTAPGLTQSKNGKYGITTQVSGEEWSGTFKIFDLATGQEINTPIKKGYDHFYAQFLNTEKVALLTQKVRYIRDIDALKQANELRRQGKRKEYEELMKRTKKAIKSREKSLELKIYDIPSATVLKRRELFANNGRAIFTIPYYKGNLVTSITDKHIAIAGYDLPYEEKDWTGPYVIQLFDTELNLLWEYNYPEEDGITDMKFINDRFLVVVGRGKFIKILDVSSGRPFIEYTRKHGRSYIIDKAFTINGQIVVQTHHINYFDISFTHVFDIESGARLVEMGDKPIPKILLLANKQRQAYYIPSKNKIEFATEK